MSKILRKNGAKKVFKMMGIVLMGVASCSYVMPVQAATTTISQSSVKDGAGSIKVKDSILTISGLKETQNKGVFKVDYILERPSGIPENTTSISMEGQVVINIDGKECEFHIHTLSATVKKISDNKISFEGSMYECETKDKSYHSVEQVKGKEAKVSVTEINYQHEYTEPGVKFKELLKNIPVIDTKQTPSSNEKEFEMIIAEMKKNKKYTGTDYILPSKNLGIEVSDEVSGCTVDNIGFVGDKLHIRYKKDKESDFRHIKIEGATREAGLHVGDFLYEVYDIKDTETLSKCKISAFANKVLLTEKDTQTITMKF